MDESTSIDLSMINNENELQKILKDSLEFPDYYGMNWSAFWDAITGLVDLPEKIVFIGWIQFTEKLPKESQKLMELLSEYNKTYPEWKCKIIYK